MNSRERLIAALQHKEPDRVPNDLGGTDVTSICRGAYVDLMNYLGRDTTVYHFTNRMGFLGLGYGTGSDRC